MVRVLPFLPKYFDGAVCLNFIRIHGWSAMLGSAPWCKQSLLRQAALMTSQELHSRKRLMWATPPRVEVSKLQFSGLSGSSFPWLHTQHIQDEPKQNQERLKDFYGQALKIQARKVPAGLTQLWIAPLTAQVRLIGQSTRLRRSPGDRQQHSFLKQSWLIPN